MEDCRDVSTPAVSTPVGADVDGAPFEESWDYRSVIGMLMYLSANSRPDICYATHQAARYSYAPKNSHAVAVKRILRYLKGTRNQGLYLRPSSDRRVDCYVDADFAGLWGAELPDDPTCVKSRTGYVIKYCDCPILWVSKLQTQIALSTMESEYLALSASMRDLIPIREILKEFQVHLFADPDGSPLPTATHSKAFADVKDGTIPSSIVYEDNQACLKFARTAKMSPRTKHIGVPYHWFRTKIANLEIDIQPVSTDSQLADQFTKGLVFDKFSVGRKALLGW